MGVQTPTIWKYPVHVTDRFEHSMPEGASVLSVGTQHGAPMMWALVDPSRPQVRRAFRVHGTGHPVPLPVGAFLGTFQLHGGELVFHVFEGE